MSETAININQKKLNMKKERVINTQKAVIAALFFGATTFGFAQDTAQATDTAATATEQVQTMQQNPVIEA